MYTNGMGLSRVQLGVYGEQFAVRLLRKLANCHTAYVSHKRYSGDIRAITRNGTIARIEVKTACLARDGKYHFTIVKTGHSAPLFAQYVILLCVIETELAVPFIIPTDDIKGLRAIAITKDCARYAGKYAKYRHAWHLVE